MCLFVCLLCVGLIARSCLFIGLSPLDHTLMYLALTNALTSNLIPGRPRRSLFYLAVVLSMVQTELVLVAGPLCAAVLLRILWLQVGSSSFDWCCVKRLSFLMSIVITLVLVGPVCPEGFIWHARHHILVYRSPCLQTRDLEETYRVGSSSFGACLVLPAASAPDGVCFCLKSALARAWLLLCWLRERPAVIELARLQPLPFG